MKKRKPVGASALHFQHDVEEQTTYLTVMGV